MPSSEHLTTLTRREREVTALIAEGLTNRQIAERLVISEKTVGRHLESIFDKLGVSSRAAAASWATREAVAVRAATVD